MAKVPTWRDVAAQQAGLIRREHLAACGVDRWAVAHRIRSERWQALPSATVVATTTGPLSLDQLHWLGVLHAGPGALLGGITAAELAGLKNWHRDDITVLTPFESGQPASLRGFVFQRTRRSLVDLRAKSASPPRSRLEPAILLFASREQNPRTIEGVLTAAVQQRKATPETLRRALADLAPLRQSAMIRRVIDDIVGGAHSVGEIDIRRLCQTFSLRLPDRQVKRRDAAGRLRFTDCEWLLPDGSVLVLEVDGGFHMDVEHWEDDLARQRALTALDRRVVRCTTRELRDEPARVARDLARLGVPRAA